MSVQYNLQEVVEQAAYSVAAVSIASVAIGIAVAAMGPEFLTLPPEKRAGTTKALNELRVAFGTLLVNKAIKEVGHDDILKLCDKIEELYKAEMYEKYGKYATDIALRSAPPGDIKTAHEIAIALAQRGYGKLVAPRDVPAPVTVLEAATREGTTRARKKAKPQKDTKTGKIYRSKAAAGMAVAIEYGLDPSETFIWYEVIKKDPDRFVSVSQAEYDKYAASL